MRKKTSNTYVPGKFEDDIMMVQEFISAGILHGTLTEAVTEALRNAMTREGSRTLSQILQDASSEWYK